MFLNRLSALEKKVHTDNGEMPESFHELKSKVDNFKEKLEVSLDIPSLTLFVFIARAIDQTNTCVMGSLFTSNITPILPILVTTTTLLMKKATAAPTIRLT